MSPLLKKFTWIGFFSRAFLIGLLAITMPLVITYQSNIEQSQAFLHEMLHGQIKLINRGLALNDSPEYKKNFLSKLRSQTEFGLDGEIVLGELVDDNIHFISRTHYQLGSTFSNEKDNMLAGPMRLALNENSGTTEGRDYDNKPVIAAYDFIDALNVGIVAKRQISTLRQPYIDTGLRGLAYLIATLTLVALGIAMWVHFTGREASRLFLSLSLQFALSLSLLVFVLVSTYRAGEQNQGDALQSLAHYQASLIETMLVASPIGFDAKRMTELLLEQEHYRGFHDSGEIVIGKVEGREINFTSKSRFNHRGINNISLDSGMATPMQLALKGEAGLIKEIDYRGAEVLAAYTPISGSGYGLVAKIDSQELRAHFIKTAATSSLLLLLGLSLSTFSLRRQGHQKPKHFSLRAHDTRANSLLLAILCLTAFIFICDLYVPQSTGGGIPYIAVIIVGLRLGSRLVLYLLAAISSTLVLAAFVYTNMQQQQGWEELVTRSFAIGIIWLSSIVLCRSITQHQHAYATATELDVLLSTVYDAIITIDTRGTIVKTAGAFEGIFGYRSDEVQGRNIKMVVGGGHAQNHDAYLQSFSQGRSYQGRNLHLPCDVAARRKDGSEFPAELSIEPFRIEGITFYSATCRDRTLELQALEDIAASRDQAQEMTRAKSEFVATVSHEIRTPLNGIIGAAELLKDSTLDSNQRPLLNAIRSSSSGLLHMINDILDVSKIEASKLDIEIIEFPLLECLDTLVQSLKPHAQKNKVSLDLFMPKELYCRVTTDPSRLKQILLNLVSNAIKFSGAQEDHQGEVGITVTMPRLEGKQWLQVEVSDNGIGMEEAALKHLFEPFTQAEQSTTRRFGGTGLGLSICQSLCELMGGEIKVNSRLGAGSCFCLRLPIALHSQNPPLDLKGLKLHLCEDNEKISQSIEYFADANGLTLLRHKSAEAALLAARSERESVLMMAESKLEASGDAIKLALNKEKINYLGLVSSLDQRPLAAFEERCLVETQPLSYTLLAESIQRFSTAPVEALAPIVTVDKEAPKGRHILVAEDNQTNILIIKAQLKKLGHSCDIAENGEIAFKLWQQNTYDLILTDCHMPLMDGYELSLNIRREEKEQQKEPAYIIAVTANAMKGEEQHCIDSGMNAFISKPVDIHVLEVGIDKGLEVLKQRRAVLDSGLDSLN